MNHFSVLDEKSNIKSITALITIRSVSKYICYNVFIFIRKEKKTV